MTSIPPRRSEPWQFFRDIGVGDAHDGRCYCSDAPEIRPWLLLREIIERIFELFDHSIPGIQRRPIGSNLFPCPVFSSSCNPQHLRLPLFAMPRRANVAHLMEQDAALLFRTKSSTNTD